MATKKSHRVGERNVNHQGLTMEIVKYVNNKNVEIVFLETGERKVVRYVSFCNRSVKADIEKYPYLVVAKAKAAVRTIKKVMAVIALVGVLVFLITYFR